MDEAAMASITAQSGVAIQLENIQIYTFDGGRELWFETGLAGDTNMAAVGIVFGDSYAYRFINRIGNPGALGSSDIGSFGSWVGDGNFLLRGDYSGLRSGAPLADGILNKGPRQTGAVFSVRVVQHREYGLFGDIGNGAYIEVGLPTIEIYSAPGGFDEMRVFVMGDGAYGVGTSPIGSGTAANQAYSLGHIHTADSGATTSILGGTAGITSLGQVPQAETSSSLGDDLTESDPWN